MGHSMIRLASEQDLKDIKRIANQNREFIGFVMKVALMEAIQKKSLFVFEDVSGVVGFVHYHPRKDGWHTIHELAVSKQLQAKGVGQQLFNTVPLPIRLKTTEDNVNALKFYAKNGMNIVGVENGKKRKLTVLEKTNGAIKYE